MQSPGKDSATARRGSGMVVFERDNYTCQYCGFDGRSFEGWLFLSVDHVVRAADGGANEASNIVTACRACNDFLNRTKTSGLDEKRRRIAKRRKEQRRFWGARVKSTIRL
ncbi:MAG: HNH endonuclease [Dehalococcoidia bacterium]|nr:HNH endonuclease [Dehalococcoidia bacterium]